MLFRELRYAGKIEIEQQQLGGKNDKASFKIRAEGKKPAEVHLP